MTIDTIDEFMDLAADNDVTFKIEATEANFLFAVGWPHVMDKGLRGVMQEWVDEHREELATVLMSMANEIRETKQGMTIITPERTH